MFAVAGKLPSTASGGLFSTKNVSPRTNAARVFCRARGRARGVVRAKSLDPLDLPRRVEGRTYYMVSGGPITVICALEHVGIVHGMDRRTKPAMGLRLSSERRFDAAEKHRLVAHLVRVFSSKEGAFCDTALTETPPVDATARVT